MYIKISLIAEVKESHTEDQLKEWLNYNFSLIDEISNDNPLKEYPLEAITDSLKFTKV